MDISIVIPTWNGLSLLQENLPSVLAAAQHYKRTTGCSTEIIVVDDGSRDATVSMLPLQFPEVRLISRPRNGGFSLACNTGFQACRMPLVALLNNDVRIQEDYLAYQAPHFHDPDVFAVCAKVFEWDQPIFANGGRIGQFRKGFWSFFLNYDAFPPSASCWIEGRRLLSACAIGGFATYNRDKLRLLEGFNPLLSPFHWEDIDLSYRGWKRGWTVHYEPRAVAYHRTSSTIKAHYRDRFVEGISFRNRLLFHWINLHSPAYLSRHLLVLFLLVLTRFLVLDVWFYRALWQAARRLGEVRRLRRREMAHSRRTDGEVSRLLAGFYDSAPIHIYYNQRDVIQRHPAFKEAQS